MDWGKGYSATYYLTQVDPVTWRDIARIEITGGSINREKTGLIESADIDCTGYDDGERREESQRHPCRQGYTD